MPLFKVLKPLGKGGKTIQPGSFTRLEWLSPHNQQVLQDGGAVSEVEAIEDTAVSGPKRAVIVTPTLDVAQASATCEQARKLAGFPCGIVIIAEEIKRGYVIPANAGTVTALAQNPAYIVYLNDDVRIEQEGWLARMVEALESNPRYGMAAPSGKCRSNPQRRGRPGMAQGIVVADRPLANFCQVVRAKVSRQVGLYDTNLIHYSGESDFSMRAREQGWLEIWVQDVYVHHDVGPVIPDWWEHDRAYYKKKWRGR